MHPGRTCPLSYSYPAEALRCDPTVQADTLWIAGGLYGNVPALQALLDAYVADAGDKALVFNGDFHWFDVDPGDFTLVNKAVLGFHALRGNVETELAAPSEGAGCGCAYPDWVGDATVDHSNEIMERLRSTAHAQPLALDALARLPMYMSALVGGARVAIVHGDAESLAGWSFSQEVLATPDGRAEAAGALERAGADVIASSHTCLPVLQQLEGGVIVNNGAAGMPNFRGSGFGIATRISVRQSSSALYRARHASIFVEAIPLRYDVTSWRRRFLQLWPPGSHAHESYWKRISEGPDYTQHDAVRLCVQASSKSAVS